MARTPKRSAGVLFWIVAVVIRRDGRMHGMAASKLPSDDVARSVAMMAIKSYGSSHSNRDLLKPDTEFDAALLLSGKVDGAKVRFRIDGKVTVAADNPTGTVKSPNALRMLLAMYQAVPKTRRKALLSSMRDGLPDANADSDDVQDLKAMIASLAKRTNRRGEVKFKASA